MDGSRGIVSGKKIISNKKRGQMSEQAHVQLADGSRGSVGGRDFRKQ